MQKTPVHTQRLGCLGDIVIILNEFAFNKLLLELFFGLFKGFGVKEFAFGGLHVGGFFGSEGDGQVR